LRGYFRKSVEDEEIGFMALPDYIIIGIQKSATTFVHEAVRSHPQVFAAPGEITVFRDLYGQEDKIPAYFENLFGRNTKGKVLGIKFPEYLPDPLSALSIKNVVPDVKLIVVLRNPIARIVSAYYHYVSHGIAPLLEINLGLSEIIQGKHFAEYPQSEDLVEYGFYYKHLSEYLKYFDKGQLLILLYEDIKANPQQVLVRVLNFLNVDNAIHLKLPKRRLGKTVSSLERLRFHRWRTPIFYGFNRSINRIFVKQDHKSIRKTIFRATTFFDKVVLALIFKDEKPKLSPELARQLSYIYERDITLLESLIGRDLSAWKNISQ
jgi:hypothetical protein